ncbi:hypothetical protein CTAYLR_002394 [Chrysophaeum taylorii]|uniref:Ion transport domain-containing protein n=1 Tax=Chrysophaeum taylorii TaxID=2483200 RepID=A0AAD7UG94_9STRA|nr:hypothetical protein CTAYLR_002394 [Chrysophaeum taylorii]
MSSSSSHYLPAQVAPLVEDEGEKASTPTPASLCLGAPWPHIERRGDSTAPPIFTRTKSTLKEEIALVKQRLRSGNRFVVSPQSREVHRWDMVTFVALIFIAIVVPFEVAFLDSRMKIDALFLLNRAIDLILAADLVLHFFLAYYDSTRGNILIKNRHLIRKRYLQSWFAIDLTSSLPFDCGLFLIGKFAIKKPSGRVFAAVKLLRLVRLARVRRIVQIQRRFEVYAAFSMSYATVGAFRLICMLFVFAHWLACAWGLTANRELIGKRTWSWVHERAFQVGPVRGLHGALFNPGSAMETYVTSLYFSIYTMTGIGYGDVHATTYREISVCCFLMAGSAMYWAFTIGSFCNLVRSMNLQESQFRRRMDDMNYMMEDRKFPRELRQRCRWFLLMSKQHQKSADYARLEALFSYSLRSDVAATINQEWLKSVWYLEDASKDFIVELSQVMTTVMFAPMEAIDIPLSLVILQSGIVARAGSIYAKGALWGLEFIMNETSLIDQTIAAALSYALVLFVHREDILDIVNSEGAFLPERTNVLRASKFYGIKMRLVRFAWTFRKRATILSHTPRRASGSVAPFRRRNSANQQQSMQAIGGSAHFNGDFCLADDDAMILQAVGGGTGTSSPPRSDPIKSAQIKSKVSFAAAAAVHDGGGGGGGSAAAADHHHQSQGDAATSRPPFAEQMNMFEGRILGALRDIHTALSAVNINIESLRKDSRSTNLEIAGSRSSMNRTNQGSFRNHRIRKGPSCGAMTVKFEENH